MPANRPTGIRPLTLSEIVVLLLLAWAIWAMGAHAQLVPIKTAPVATGSQFQLYPSQARGMGAVSLAVDDTLSDAFENPATAARLDGTWAFSVPSYYTITGPDGGARTLSVGVLVDRGRWFGGLAGALQQLNPGPEPRQGVVSTTQLTFLPRPEPPALRPLGETTAENHYLTALAGRQLTDQWALAGHLQWARLTAMEGVDLLYPGNEGLRQEGHRLDLRLGLLREWRDRSLQLLLVHDRVHMQHDVRYLNYIWRDGTAESFWDTRWEQHYDRTNTWGLHLAYDQPLGTEGWRLGTVVTGNRKDHPKIPNYDLMSIPRDPGTSWASNVGIGVSHTGPHTTIGADLVFEPILSETWTTAQEPVEQPGGGVIESGERTVVNDFTFANTSLRTGLRHRQDWWALQAGLEVRTIRYWLTQNDRVVESKRDQYEGWSEWMLSWSGSVEWNVLTLRYTGALTLGTGRPGVTSIGVPATAEFATAGDFVPAPEGTLGVRTSRVFTHRIALTIPLRHSAR